MVDVSIIIPIFNVDKYLERCIEGVLAQTHDNFELILVNDGSPDNSGIICDNYSKKDRRIKVIHQENQGVGAARNNGLAIATGKYIYFCDPDDYIKPTLISDNFLLAEENDANMVIFGYYDEIDTKNEKKITPRSYKAIFLEKQQDFRNEFERLLEEKFLYTLWNKLYRREYLMNFGIQFGQQKVGEDAIFNYHVFEKIDKVYINEKHYYYYVMYRVGSAVNIYRDDRFEIRYEESMELEKLLKKWGEFDKFKILIQNEWISTLWYGLTNLFNQGCPLSEKDKIKRIKSFIRTPKIKDILTSASIKDIKSSFMKIEMLLLKKEYILFAYYLLKFRNVIKRSYS